MFLVNAMIICGRSLATLRSLANFVYPDPRC